MSDFICSMDDDDLADYVARQLNTFYPDRHAVDAFDLTHHVTEAMARVYASFRNIKKKYYSEGENTLFNHLNSDHYASFLYLLSNTVHRSGMGDEIASKIFMLNKALHGLDAFYGVELPEIFLFVHPVGTVIGNGTFGNYFVIYQNCAVGATPTDGYPTFGEGVLMYAKSTVIGGCKVGNNVVLGANTFVLNHDIPDRTTVVGTYPHLKFKHNEIDTIDRIFR